MQQQEVTTTTLVRDDHDSLTVDPALFRDAPFFSARWNGGRVVHEGQSSVALGTRVSGPGGNGVFAEWDWDGERFELRTDRLGMFPIFYASTDQTIIVSTSVFRILSLGVESHLNWPGLGVFLRTGSFMATDTPFEQIKALPPNAHLVWRSGQLELSGEYWLPAVRNRSRSDAVDDYVSAFRTAIARRLPEGDFAMPLSGGRDSRHILLELCAQGAKPRFVLTGRRFPPERTIDERVAADVAAATGVEHRVVGPPKREVPSYLAANVLTNMTAPRRGWKLSVVRHLQQAVDTSYDGIGGDMLSGGSAVSRKALDLLDAGKLDEFCRSAFVNKIAHKFIPGAQLARMTDEAVVEHMVPEVERHLAAANPATSFHFWNRTRRFDSTNPFGMQQCIPTVHTPFLDLDVFETLSSLPPEYNLSRTLHDEAIAKSYPEYAAIPYEPDDVEVSTEPAHVRKSTWDMACFLAERRPRFLVRPEFYLSRAALSAISFGHSSRRWIPRIVYLTLLESIARDGVTALHEATMAVHP